VLRKPRRNNPRKNDNYDKCRRDVFRRDKYCCQMPECKSRYRIQMHHITRYADSINGRNNPENCITLCKRCHEKVTGHETHYAQMFFGIVRRKYEDNS
jgi:5-methylcytosine-specific restriction endonuclease McrA